MQTGVLAKALPTRARWHSLVKEQRFKVLCPLGHPRGVLQQRWGAGLPSCVYLWWPMSRSVVALCVRDAEEGQRERSWALAALCSELITEGKAHSVQGLLTTLSRCRK